MKARKEISAWWLAFLPGLLFCAADAAEVMLVEDGRAMSTIVVGEDDGLSAAISMERSTASRGVPGGNIGMAARDLAAHLNDMAWIGDPRHQVRVVDDIAEADTPYRILLGTAAIDEYGLEEEAARHPHWSYTYRTEGNDLLIFGSSSKGAANGVYGFLQNELGVRWFGPGELFRTMPSQETISVEDVERRDDPDFTGRFSAISQWDHPVGMWTNRMRVAEPGAGQAVPFYSRPHQINNIFSLDQYGDRPELYAKKGGRRYLRDGGFALCYSNPEVVDIATEYALEYFRGGEHRHSIPINANDSFSYCECEDCAELQPERSYRGMRVASDMWWHFANEVARRVREEFPDRYISSGGSRDLLAPPLGEIEDNLFRLMQMDLSEYYDEEFRAEEMELIDGWAEKGINLGTYYYTGLAKLVPAYFPRTLAQELRYMHEQGFVAAYTEAHPGWPWKGPMHYVQARLWWDVDLDVDELLEEYFTKLYGPAAPYVAELYGLFEEIHMRPRSSGGLLYEHYNFAQFRPYTGEDLARMRELLSSAHEAIEELSVGRLGRENLESRRLAYISQSLRLFLDMLEGVVLARELQGLKIEADDAAVFETVWKLDRIATLLDRHIQVYREAIITDQTHSNRFLNDTATPVRNYWQRHLTSTLITTLANLYAGRDGFSGRTREILEERVAEHTREPLARAAFMVEAEQAELEENLARNPGFEEIDEAGAPVNWGSTSPDRRAPGSAIDTVEHEELTERFGARSGRMKGISGSAWYLNSVPGIEPGEMYLFEVDAKILLPETRLDPGVAMRVQWLGPEGWVRGEHTYETPLVALNQWERLRVVGLAPDGVNRAQVFLRVSGLRDGEEVLLDNLQVQRIGE